MRGLHTLPKQGPFSPCQEAAGGLGPRWLQVVAVDCGGKEGVLRLYTGCTAQRLCHQLYCVVDGSL